MQAESKCEIGVWLSIPQSSQISSSQALTLKRIFNCIAASRILLEAKLDQHLSAFWIRSPIARSLLSAVNKSLQDTTPAFCSAQHGVCGQSSSPQSVGWRKYTWSTKMGNQQSRFSWHQNVLGSLWCFTRLLTAAQKNLTLAFFNALRWTVNANLYSCQHLSFSHFPPKLHWPMWNVFLTYRGLS